jgi:NADPH:quinone reductase-like Zn-dependent oxidoreductase
MLELAAPQSLGPDEVVIAVRAAGVGNRDEVVRVGGWDVGRQPPLVLGSRRRTSSSPLTKR